MRRSGARSHRYAPRSPHERPSAARRVRGRDIRLLVAPDPSDAPLTGTWAWRAPGRPASAAAGDVHPLEDRALHALDGHALLAHLVAVADRHRAVLERVDVDRDAPRRTDLVLAPVELADRGGVVVDGHEVALEVGL